MDPRQSSVGPPASTLRLLSAAEVERLIEPRGLLDATRAAFEALAVGEAAMAERGHVDSPWGPTLAMAGRVGDRALAAKVISVRPGNPGQGLPRVPGLALVLDPTTGVARGLVEGASLTVWRTAAAAAVAADALARDDAAVGALIGCGALARTHLRLLCAVRPLREVRVFGRHPERLAAFVAANAGSVEAELIPVASSTAAVQGADVVEVVTGSSTPVVAGRDLDPGTHLDAMGSFQLSMEELDDEAVVRATVVVDDLEAALAEAGELVAAERAGRTNRSQWRELGAVLRGAAPGRRDAEEITLFKSVGLAIQDAAVATWLLGRAEERGLGQEVPW